MSQAQVIVKGVAAKGTLFKSPEPTPPWVVKSVCEMPLDANATSVRGSALTPRYIGLSFEERSGREAAAYQGRSLIRSCWQSKFATTGHSTLFLGIAASRFGRLECPGGGPFVREGRFSKAGSSAPEG